MPLSLGLLGTGRLGSAIRAAADGRDDVDVVWSVGRGEVPGTAVDVAVDVSHAAAVAGHLAWAQRTGTALVVGTTGWDAALLPVAPSVPVLVAPNFSLGVALVSRLARVLGGYAAHAPVPVDLAVTDTHHRHKVDAPSGTALTLRASLAAGAGRDAADVQTTSLRIGFVVGDHEVVASSELETITLRHTAHSPDLFASGALSAAAWLAARPERGVYTLDDLAAEHLAGLLGSTTPTPRPRPGAAAPAAVA
ncbi:4-hydroxy-tetrahydrodipicolinate reductase [Ornithinimicrobium sp. LYQ121]|uniref:4-hydroxy-tetrahydrodipicolinate reductase n=1 Tax=Ornithinimicrobium sp. LYQ121 TaxID=3378801 RepID=UPI0038551377